MRGRSARLTRSRKVHSRKHRVSRAHTKRGSKSMRKMHRKRRGGKTTKRMHRMSRHRGGAAGPTCGPVAPQSGAACNASSGASYAEVMVGDAVEQMRRSASSMLA